MKGLIVAFVDGDENTPSIKFVTSNQIKTPSLNSVGNRLRLPEVTLPFKEEETPLSRLGVPGQTILFVDENLELKQGVLKNVSIYDSNTGSKHIKPDPNQRVIVDVNGVDIFTNYLECLVLNTLSKNVQHEHTSPQTTEVLIQQEHIPSRQVTFSNGANINAGGYSWIGTERQEDEDSIGLAISPDHIDLVLADGMGGYNNGKQAADLAVKAYYQALTQGKSLIEAINEADRVVFDFNSQQKTDSGATFVAARIDQTGHIQIINAGDSPAFMIRSDGSVTQLTINHTLVQRLFDTGQINAEEIRTHPQKNIVYRNLGNKSKCNFDDSRFENQLNKGQALLLTCDGLDDMLLKPPSGEPVLTIQGFIMQIAEKLDKHVSSLTSDDLWDHIKHLKQLGYQAPDNVSFLWLSRTN